MLSFSPCKINLGLHIINKRPDAYHNLETIFYPVPWHDIIEMVPSEDFSFTSSGLHIDSKAEDNLVVKAWNLIKAEYTLPEVKIHLHKAIPFGAGLGGGSADAASTLKLANKLFQLDISSAQLENYASRLGADCPFFIENRPAFGQGIGTDLSPVSLSLKGKYLLILKPDVHISTAEAYAGVRNYSQAGQLMQVVQQPVEQWKIGLRNDFQEAIFSSHPVLADLLNDLYNSGAIYAAMSGSGSAIFGIFNHEITFIPSAPCIKKGFSL
jgi:4-diphosphocytidyl-2-C-methyl-D-erythritol kinase